MQKKTKKNQNIPIPPAQDAPYYVASVPAEPESKYPGRAEGIISIICAILSLILFPLIIGITGIVLGVKSKKKGARSIGIAGIVISSLFMAIGIIISVLE